MAVSGAIAGAERTDPPTVLIRPSRGWPAPDLGELRGHHELLYFLVWRTLKVRYKQTALGAGWAVAQPFLTMIVFSVFFGRLARIPSNGDPYPVFAYTALVPWTFFATALAGASNSLVEHERMLTKVYFPRLLLPLAAVCASLVDFAIAFVVLLGLLAWYGIAPGAQALTLPLLVALAFCTALAVGLWLAAVNVQYRDVRHVTPFLVQLWLFVSPVAYPTSLVPERWRALYGLNPMAGVVDGFRWALLDRGEPPPATVMAASAVAVALLLVGGLFYFRRMERTFADVV
ncbi:MAG TPA: ABC transporter permease [Gemmatimonadales bacterium]|nr:ABC transporter permease [Gemmatimonadales bacterium]